jgi:hypothetical protein
MNVTRRSTEYRKINDKNIEKKVLPHRWAARSPIPSSTHRESVDWGVKKTPVSLPVSPGTAQQTSCNAGRVGGRGARRGSAAARPDDVSGPNPFMDVGNSSG